MRALLSTLALAMWACESSGPGEPDDQEPASLRNKVVFKSSSSPGKTGLFVADPDAAILTALTPDTLNYDCPRVSPDAKRVMLVRQGAVYIINADGTGERLLAPVQNGAGFYRCPEWSPQGDKIAFIAMIPQVKAPSPGAVYLIDPESGAKTTLVNGHNFSGVEWSRDGTKLLIGSNDYTSGGPYNFRVSVVNLDGSRVSQVVSNYWNLSWAPDASEFAYQCGASTLQVCIANVDGTNVRMLTSPDTSAEAPRWSPDGTMIAYFAAKSIFVMNRDGTAKKRIVPDVASSDMSWSPDSKRLAFKCLGGVRFAEVMFSSDICVANTDGSAFKRLTTLVRASEMPSWGPM